MSLDAEFFTEKALSLKNSVFGCAFFNKYKT